MDELLSLKWNNHCPTFLQVLCNVREKKKYTDVTLACAGKFYSVHKIVLSSCSDYFKDIFDTTDSTNLVIVIKDIKSAELESILDYMYIGEVNVKQNELSSLIKVAECLKIKGLAVADDEIIQKTEESLKKRTISPKPRRKRKLDDVDNCNTSPSAKVKITSQLHSDVDVLKHPDKVTTEIVSDYEDLKNIVVKEEVNNSVEQEFLSIVAEDNISSNPQTNNVQFDPLDYPSEESSSIIDKTLQMDNNTYPDNSYNKDDSNDWQDDDSNMSFSQINYTSNDTSNPASTAKQRSCHICSKVFKCHSQKEIHMRVHTGEKPYACTFCSYRTKQKGALKTHMKCRHNWLPNSKTNI